MLGTRQTVTKTNPNVTAHTMGGFGLFSVDAEQSPSLARYGEVGC